MNLHFRLAFRYAAVLFGALLLLAIGAVVTIDRTLRTSLDGRLHTEAVAVSSLVDARRGNVQIDGDDRRQFAALMQNGEQSIVVDRAGHVVFSTVLLPPPAIAAVAKNTSGIYDAGSGDAQARASVEPVMREGVRAGTVVVWRPSEWIEQADRGTSIAFIAASLVIAAIAVAAGIIVTRRALDDAFARQRRFTAAASHELRAPLAVIRAEADLALRKERSPGEYAASLQTIAAETDHLESLTADLLAAARAESRKAQRAPFDAAELLQKIAGRLEPLAYSKRVALHVAAAGPAFALGDAAEIERALLALGHNALKHTQEGGNVTLSARTGTGWVEVCVDDDGPGFSKASLEHAFEPFWRDDSARSQGSGLGLALAKAVIEASGGSIALGNGTSGAHVAVLLAAARSV